MRERLLKWLVCPRCKNNLIPEFFKMERGEILEGVLICGCGNNFPIIKGVPRFVSDALQYLLPRLYPDFYLRHPGLLKSEFNPTENKLNVKNSETMDRFGYEWTHFSDYSCDNFQEFISPLSKNCFLGKLGLDAGCGAGRHIRKAGQKGAEMVGIDLSQAVDAAHRNNLDNDRIHIVQADIYNLPFDTGIFHFIYSLGVLHHLPEPESGYKTLVPLLHEGGALFIWVYAYATRKVLLELLRFVSQKLSSENIRRMAFLCNLVDYGVFVNLYRLLKNIPVFRNFVDRHAPLRVKEYAKYGLQVAYTDWYDRLSAPITNYYKESDLKGWVARSGLGKSSLELVGDSWWWVYGERIARS